MSEDVRYGIPPKTVKKVKRLKNGFKRRQGNTPSGTIPKTVTRCFVSSKEMEELRKRQCQVRVIGLFRGQKVKDVVKERDVIYVLEMTDKLRRALKDIHNDSRKESRTGGGGGGGGNPPSRIFHRLVDENKMSDCILHIKESFFHDEKECNICKKKCNLYDFFMLVNFYFIYIGILEKDTSQLAFCKYLNKKVFGGNDIVNVRSFNNYTKMEAYKNFAKLLSDKKDIRFDSRPQMSQAKPENFLLAPFQEIGWKFQHSDYFDELRREKNKVQEFVL